MSLLKNISVSFLLLACNSCLFSSDDIVDYHLVGSYYVNSFAGKQTLLYKNSDDLNSVGNGTVIIENIDSIGWYKSTILAVSNNRYFIVDSSTHKIRETFLNYSDLTNISVHSFNLKKIGE